MDNLQSNTTLYHKRFVKIIINSNNNNNNNNKKLSFIRI
jgi:hypothetical protein